MGPADVKYMIFTVDEPNDLSSHTARLVPALWPAVLIFRDEGWLMVLLKDCFNF